MIRKSEKLKEIAMGVNNNKTKLRFPGFTDPGEQRKFGDIIVKLTGGASIAPDDYQEEGVRTIPKGAVNSTGVADLSGSKKVTKQFFERNISSIVSADNLVTSLRDLVPSAPNMGRIVRILGEQEDFLMPQGVYKIELNDRTDGNFVIAYSNSERYRKIISSEKNGSTQVHIRNGEFFNIDISTPSYEEQTKIGTFFVSIDNLIILHQRKLNHLQDKKKSLLQKMFPKNGEDFPELRFPEFTDPWEQRKLSELLIPADERNNAVKYTQDDVLAASLGTELVKKYIFFGLRSTEESVKNYRVVNSGDVIYTKSPIKGYPNGIIRTNKGLDGIVPSLYCVYHSIPSINSSIIQNYFEDKGRLDAYLHPLVNIGARNNVNITDLGFLEGTIFISQDIDEQNKIVAFFNHLINLITLHQRKLNHLQEQKKALLQQMFV